MPHMCLHSLSVPAGDRKLLSALGSMIAVFVIRRAKFTKLQRRT